ncbi:HlyD family type I secretion periplasmic adaptor subunit [Aliirhizobium smilacinae]|uniref:Membrane fusion protein (MFP) family protein n=1 Tax=Aliirhizobium smilacinae TaxID=1395944 RepID=A0A5C4XPS4_9HYPH|nr:HlyD family type I secretion periplasmic adaptor subunit [Rhizobium smilacinae]TNM65298.1 HlyD family type I secretion periplasmic adaptor subunit [Rhizobium smilacinae]
MSDQPSQHSLRRHVIFFASLATIFLASVGGWAATTKLSNAIIGDAIVIMNDNAKSIQHLNGGIVSELLVREGDHVRAGDVLVRLDGTALKASLSVLDTTFTQLAVRRIRLEAEQQGRSDLDLGRLSSEDIDIKRNRTIVDGEYQLFLTRKSSLAGMKNQLEERKSQLREETTGNTLQITAIDDAMHLIEEELSAISALYEKQIVTMQRVNALKRQKIELVGNRGERIAARAQAEGKIAELNLQILQLDEDRRTKNATDLTELEANITEIEQRRLALLDQLQRLDLRAPLSGRIYQLSIHTVGGVANPREPLMLLAPDDQNLTVEAKIAPRDIDQLHPGQGVAILFSAFDQRTTPQIDGKVVSISPDVVVDQRNGNSYYPVRIEPSTGSLAQLSRLSLYPGMPAEVFIKIKDRSVISYFSKPLTDQLAHTFRQE